MECRGVRGSIAGCWCGRVFWDVFVPEKRSSLSFFDGILSLLHKVSGTRLLVQQRRVNQEFWGSPSKLAQKLPRYLHCSNMLFSNGDLHHKMFLEVSSLDLNYVSKLKWEILLSHENFREPRLTFFLLKTRQNAKVFLDRERLMEHHDGNTETFRVRKIKYDCLWAGRKGD